MSNFSIVQEKEFPLLKRKNFTLQAEFPKKPTPSGTEVKKEVAAFLKSDEKKIAVRHIKQVFGSNAALITVHVYQDEKSLKDIEEIKKRKKKEGDQQGGKENQAKK